MTVNEFHRAILCGRVAARVRVEPMLLSVIAMPGCRRRFAPENVFLGVNRTKKENSSKKACQRGLRKYYLSNP
jgi:hypothetical protein